MPVTLQEAALLDRIARSTKDYRISLSTLPEYQHDVARSLVRAKYIRGDWDGGNYSITPAGRHALDEFQNAQQEAENERQRQRNERRAEALRSDDQQQNNRRNTLIASVLSAVVGSLVTLLVQFILGLI